MFPKCTEHSNAEETLSQYSRNIAYLLEVLLFVEYDG